MWFVIRYSYQLPEMVTRMVLTGGILFFKGGAKMARSTQFVASESISSRDHSAHFRAVCAAGVVASLGRYLAIRRPRIQLSLEETNQANDAEGLVTRIRGQSRVVFVNFAGTVPVCLE